MATTTTPNKSASSSSEIAKSLSPAARQAVGVGALILCLIVGAGLVYWLLFASVPKRRTVTVDPSLQTQDNGRRGGMRMQRPPEPPIAKMSDSMWRVRGNGAEMLVEKRGAEWGFTFNAGGGVTLPADQRKILSARVRIISDQAMAKQWAVTPEQMDKLRNMGATRGMEPPAADKGAIAGLWGGYMSAADGQPKTDAQQKVVQKLNEIIQANREPLLKVYADRTELVKSILTPEQIQTILK